MFAKKKKHETIVEGQRLSLTGTSWQVSHVQIVLYTWVLVAKDKSNHPVADSLRSVPQDCTN